MIDVVIQDRWAGLVQAGREIGQVSSLETTVHLSPDQLLQTLSPLWDMLARVPDRKIRLVLPSSWCYVHPLEVAQRRPSRTMLAYALEDFLPVGIEGLTCDFMPMQQGRTLGIAIENQRVQPLLAVFRERRLNVAQISLDVMRFRPRDAVRFVWCDEGHIALLNAENADMTGLRVMRLRSGLQESAWVDHVATLIGESHDHRPDNGVASSSLLVIGGLALSDRVAELATAIPGSKINDPLDSAEPSIAFDLGRDQLAPVASHTRVMRAWRDTAAVMLVASCILIASLYVNQLRTNREMNRIVEWEREVFASVFPGQKPPAAIGTRLASERQRLEALTAPTAKDAQPRALDALKTLHDTIAAIPTELRLDLQEHRIEGSDVTLRGRTRDHQTAETIGKLIDALPDWQCDPVRTDRHRDAGVQFFLHGKYKPATAGTDARP